MSAQVVMPAAVTAAAASVSDAAAPKKRRNERHSPGFTVPGLMSNRVPWSVGPLSVTGVPNGARIGRPAASGFSSVPLRLLRSTAPPAVSDGGKRPPIVTRSFHCVGGASQSVVRR